MNNVESLGYVFCGYGYMNFLCHEKKRTCSHDLAVSVTFVLEHLQLVETAELSGLPEN
jgi:hypothetical protein